MCILFAADKRRPTEEELEKMAITNPDGAGIAYRVGEGSKLRVKWEKGLTLEQMQVLCAEVPMPFVGHFRIASCGPKTAEVTHPFPVEREMRSDLSGSTPGFVLFHNGHWGPWRDKGIDNAIKMKVKVPDGKWTDTRVMAWLAHLLGPNVLELIDEKVILFGTHKIEVYHPDGWTRINDLLVSNRLWEHRYVSRRNKEAVDDFNSMEGGGFYGHQGVPNVCKTGNCKNAAVGLNGWYCEEHQPPCRFATCSKPRVPGSENCEDHQPFCQSTMCSKPRLVGERFCALHKPTQFERLALPPVKVASQPQVGGTGGIIPFRRGDTVVQGGENQQGGDADAQGTLGSVDKGNQGRTHVPAILTDPLLQERSRWARSLNPKAVRSPLNTLLDGVAEKIIGNHKAAN